MLITNRPPTIFESAEALALARKLQAESDDGWKFRAVMHDGRRDRARVDVWDETDTRVGAL